MRIYIKLENIRNINSKKSQNAVLSDIIISFSLQNRICPRRTDVRRNS